MKRFSIQIRYIRPNVSRWDDVVPTFHEVPDDHKPADYAAIIAEATRHTVRLTYIPDTFTGTPTAAYVGRLNGHYFQSKNV